MMKDRKVNSAYELQSEDLLGINPSTMKVANDTEAYTDRLPTLDELMGDHWADIPSEEKMISEIDNGNLTESMFVEAEDTDEKLSRPHTNTQKVNPVDIRTPSIPDCDFPTKAQPLWKVALASKEHKPKEKQVWIDEKLYRKVEMLNIKNGKPVPTKHLLNAIIRWFLYDSRNTDAENG